jgi:hypothetical protein
VSRDSAPRSARHPASRRGARSGAAGGRDSAYWSVMPEVLA